MPRYYFHVRNHIQTEDEEGMDLPDPTAARAIALDAARDLVCASIHENGNVNLDHYILITDEADEQVMTLTFREAFTIEG
jgi:uncharacterized protein DUF6894